MLRVHITQEPPSTVVRGSPFPVTISLVNECGSNPTGLPPFELHATLVKPDLTPIPGQPLLELSQSSQGDFRSSKKIVFDRNGVCQARARILPTCNKLHYSSTTHTRDCYHHILHPLRIRAHVTLPASALATGGQSNQPKQSAAKEGKKSEAGASRGKGKGKGASSTDAKRDHQSIENGGKQTEVTDWTKVTLLPVSSALFEVQSANTGNGTANTKVLPGIQSHLPPVNGPVREIGVGPVTLRLLERPTRTRECTGNVVWDCALLFANHLLATLGKPGLRHKRIVEVGCGTGAVGLVCSMVGARVCLTDIGEGVALAAANAGLNSNAVKAAGGEVKAVELEWGTNQNEINPEVHIPADIVIGCEVVYDNDWLAPLVKTMGLLSDEKSLVLLAGRRRGADLDVFFGILNEVFEVERIDFVLSGATLGQWSSHIKVSQPPWLYCLRKRKTATQ